MIMYLAIALTLSFLYAALMPLSDGLFDTSMWASKIMAPTGIDGQEGADKLLKTGQAALMDGWLSNIPFITSILIFASLITSVFYHWWAAIPVLIVSVFLSSLAKLLWTRSVFYYLSLIHHKMLNRAADYRRSNDISRYEASESYCRELEQLLALYEGAPLRPPTAKQLKQIPYGEASYWLEHGAGGA